MKRVHDHSSIHQAIRRLEEDRHFKHDILLETYIDEQEVDANFILWEGKLLFIEIPDGFPCQADVTDATIEDNLVANFMILPSLLPHNEIETLRSCLYQSLLHLGFRSGVFQVEAWVQSSSTVIEKATAS